MNPVYMFINQSNMRQRIKTATDTLDSERAFFCIRALHMRDPLRTAPAAAIKFNISRYITAILLRRLMDLSWSAHSSASLSA